jgi:hypothetical protein
LKHWDVTGLYRAAAVSRGSKNQTKEKIKMKKKVALLSAALSIIALSTQAQTIIDGSGSDMDEAARRSMFDRVTEDTADPVSAQFRRLWRAPNTPDGNAAVWCGEVNRKNRMGGYIGFRKFYFTRNLDRSGKDDLAAILGDSEITDAVVSILYPRFCPSK